MDYEAIYDDFIESRRKTEAETAAREYTERHHIVPRCFGGNEADENLIRLTYRDHVFAHALLLKAARTEEARWYMAASMAAVLDFDGHGRRGRPSIERRYQWARRMHGESIRGPAHPSYRHDEHILWHADGRVVRGTRQELIQETGLPFRRLNDLVNGHREHHSGWCSTEHEWQCRVESEQARGSRHKRIDGRLYHVDGRTASVKDRHDFDRLGILRNDRARLKRDGFMNGWCLDPREAVLRAEGRWRRDATKTARDFGSRFSRPICPGEEETNRRKPMSRAFHNYIKFVALNTVERKSDAHPHAVFASPLTPEDSDYGYASAADWAHANVLWLRALEHQRLTICARKHAKSILRAMRKDRALENEELAALCRRLAGTHGNASTKIHTLFCQDGRRASGTPMELRVETGLPHGRIHDLLSGRRRYIKGWAGTEAEAKRGFVGGGRRRKNEPAPEPEFFQESGASFF